MLKVCVCEMSLKAGDAQVFSVRIVMSDLYPYFVSRIV